ncbi:MAG TPA: hypothetical protein VFB96_04180 [Pirellulaceae bacterium]|nr:hypothetical protein [Pirellulaceae bacterium]
MSQPLLPSLGSVALRLARDNRRVGRAVDDLPMLLTQLMAAWARRDQRALSELSFRLVTAAASLPELSEVALEFDKRIRARDLHAAQRELLALVGEAGSLRRRGILPATIRQQTKSS